MRSTVTRHTSVEGVRAYAPEPAIASDRRPVPMWRQRATDPDSVGVSDRFRVTAVDMTGRLVVRP